MSERHPFLLKSLFCIALAVFAVALLGCAATVTALKYKDLDVQTRMSESIFLEPTPPEKRTVWIEVKSTSDEAVDLAALTSYVAAKGYQVVSDPDAAHYRLQVNVLYVGRADEAAVDSALRAGFGGPIAGIGAGAAAGAAIGNTSRSTAIGAGIGALIGFGAEYVAGALVKKVTFTVITDLQLSEQSAIPVAQQQTATLTQGTQTHMHQRVAETSQWRRYRTRVASTATKVNLEFTEAKPLLVERLLRSLAGIF